MSEERVLLALDGVGKSYRGRSVLTAASLDVTPGRVVALMGRNGQGKSTLFRIAVGLVRPDYGRVVYRGEHLPRPSLPSLAMKGVMYSAQSAAMTALYTVGAHLSAITDTFGGAERMQDVIGALALGEYLNRRPGQVSTGERQRAALGMALLRRPECLLMDEPFAGVEPKDRVLIANGIEFLKAEGTAIAVSGHDVDDLLGVADDVVWVTAGTTHRLGSPSQAAEHFQFRQEYLGSRSFLAPSSGSGAGTVGR